MAKASRKTPPSDFRLIEWPKIADLTVFGIFVSSLCDFSIPGRNNSL
jgi:hypothetical protein